MTGNGYTNHCPACLWSKHVDDNPGDRAGSCGALMEPFRLEYVRGQFVIIHRCTRCGAQRRNRAAADDDLDALL